MQPIKFRKAAIDLDANESYWYRMAFLDIGYGLASIDSTTVDTATLDLIYNSLDQRYKELCKEKPRSKAAAR